MKKKREDALAALRKTFAGSTDEKGYVARPEDNLIDEVCLDQFESDVIEGAGNELKGKFLAVHSSTALAVNSFAPFKSTPSRLTCCGKSGFDSIRFERECRTGLRGGTHPHLDVWLASQSEVIAIESKLTEYFDLKSATYTDSYQRKTFPHAEDCWWDVLEESKTAGKYHLDVAQLVKHYLGLVRHLETSDVRSVTLLYLYWEPKNAERVDACLQHREQVQAFQHRVAASKIQFEFQSYANLWNEWQQDERLTTHVENLRARYEVEI